MTSNHINLKKEDLIGKKNTGITRLHLKLIPDLITRRLIKKDREKMIDQQGHINRKYLN